MSRSRRSKEHLQQIQDQRRQQRYHHKKQNNGMSTSAELSLLNFQLNKPEHALIFLLLASYTVGVSASISPKQKAYNQKEITDLLQQKMVIDSSVTKPADIKRCEQVQKNIIEAATAKHFNNGHVVYTLNQEKFKIRCTNQFKPISEELSTNVAVNAQFVSSSQEIEIPAREDLLQSIIRHEFYHGFNFFYHQAGKCKSDNSNKSMSPIFPRTQNEIDKYNKAFDLGDKRIKEFEALLAKSQTNSLSREEGKLLKKYKEAAEYCLAARMTSPIPEAEYRRLKQLFANDSTLIIPVHFGVLNGKIIGVEKANNQFEMHVESSDGVSAVIMMEMVKAAVLASEPYTSFPALLQLAEREAFTCQGLTEKALQVFYPEAHALRQTYLERCNPEGELATQENFKSGL